MLRLEIVKTLRRAISGRIQVVFLLLMSRLACIEVIVTFSRNYHRLIREKKSENGVRPRHAVRREKFERRQCLRIAFGRRSKNGLIVRVPCGACTVYKQTIDGGGQNVPAGNIQIVFQRFLSFVLFHLHLNSVSCCHRSRSTSMNVYHGRMYPASGRGTDLYFIFGNLQVKTLSTGARTKQKCRGLITYLVRSARDDYARQHTVLSSLSARPFRPCIGTIINSLSECVCSVCGE